MDSGNKDKFISAKINKDPLNYNAPNLSSEWQHFTNSSMGSVPTGNPVDPSSTSSASMLDAYCPMTWEHPITSQNLGFRNNNIQNNTGIDRPHDIVWNPASSLLKGGIFLPNTLGLIPPSLTQFPADSGFIERAARFSCFSTGNFSDMVNPFCNAESMSPHLRIAQVTKAPHSFFMGEHSQMNEMDITEGLKNGTEGSPLKSDRRSEILARSHGAEKQDIPVSENMSDEAEVSGHDEELSGSAKRFNSNKRKRLSQDTKPDQVNVMLPNSGEGTKGGENLSSPPSKNTGKNSKQGSQASEPAKDEYIHIRARRGQATNSHSLAERVRREKISERMKFLQDLVPCCSKVTGKAVMLDEIINYVQSLQRQVEFLSMKLATVNPQLDFNMEGLLSKDSRVGPSSTLGFPPDLSQSYHQQGTIQADLPSSVDTFRRTINTHLATMSGGLKEPRPTPQLPNAWEDELHNIVQMGFGPNTSTDSQDLNGRSC